MSKVKLSIEDQIEVLSIARKNLSNTTDNDNNGTESWFNHGVCVYVYRVIRDSEKFSNEIYELDEIKEYVDGLTKANATRLAIKYGFDIPHGKAKHFWWVKKSKWNAPRIAFLDAMITELKLSLKK